MHTLVSRGARLFHRFVCWTLYTGRKPPVYVRIEYRTLHYNTIYFRQPYNVSPRCQVHVQPVGALAAATTLQWLSRRL